MPTRTDLLIGSTRLTETQTMAVTATATTEDCDVAAGNYYLYDDESAFDSFLAVINALDSHSILTGNVYVTLGVDLHVHLVSTGAAFSLNWADAIELRDMLGFTINLTSATTHRAPNISPLLWSAGRTTTWEARVGTNGIKIADVARGQSGPGTVRSNRHNTHRRNTLIYRYVLNSRVWTEDEENGEFVTFWDQVLVPGHRFKVWRNYLEDLNDSSSELSPHDPTDFGPIPSGNPTSESAFIYVGPNEMPFGREFGYHESVHPVTIPVVTTREFDAP
jgi:hypothetical protein